MAQVGYYNAIIDKLDSEVLKMVEETISTQKLLNVENEDEGSVEGISTAVEIDWSFHWFRYITPLEPTVSFSRVGVSEGVEGIDTATNSMFFALYCN